jgi:hypothetical protein
MLKALLLRAQQQQQQQQQGQQQQQQQPESAPAPQQREQQLAQLLRHLLPQQQQQLALGVSTANPALPPQTMQRPATPELPRCAMVAKRLLEQVSTKYSIYGQTNKVNLLHGAAACMHCYLCTKCIPSSLTRFKWL